MARASADRRRRPRPAARTKRQVARGTDDLLFFSRLRRRAKWVFAFLAGVFALSFVALGVGTGVSGTSVGDILADVFGGGGSSGPSVDEAQAKVDANPNDPDALLELVTAFESNGRTKEAAATLRKYTALRPDDAAALNRLAGLYQLEVHEAGQRAALLRAREGSASFGAIAFTFPGSSGFLTELGRDPVEQALSGSLASQAQDAEKETSRLSGELVAVYEKLTQLTPNEPTLYLLLGQAAENAGETDSATEAYRRYLELAPDSPEADAVRARLRLFAATSEELTG